MLDFKLPVMRKWKKTEKQNISGNAENLTKFKEFGFLRLKLV